MLNNGSRHTWNWDKQLHDSFMDPPSPGPNDLDSRRPSVVVPGRPEAHMPKPDNSEKTPDALSTIGEENMPDSNQATKRVQYLVGQVSRRCLSYEAVPRCLTHGA